MTDTAPMPSPIERRAPRWMWIVLILSLAFNLLIVGAAAGALWHFRDGHRLAHRSLDGLVGYLRTLPADRREAIATLLKDDRATSRSLRRRAREKRREAARAFEADPLDADRLAVAAREASAARIALLRQREELLSKLAQKLTAEERRAYLKSLRDRRHRWRRWRNHGNDR